MFKSSLKYVTLLLLAACTIIFGFTTLKRARLTYENGRYFDEINSIVYHQQAVLVYFVLFIVVILLSIFLLVNINRSQYKI
jgi:hypothetical protein